MKTNLKVSVIIPILNSEKTLERCLTSIFSNKTKYNFEVIIIDGGSRDDSLRIAKSYNCKILKTTANTGYQRNLGIQNAKGEFICFTDSDCIVPSNWIEFLVDNLIDCSKKDSKIVGIGGPNIPILEKKNSVIEKSIICTLRSPLVNFRSRNFGLIKKKQYILHNPPINSIYFKWILTKVNGFGTNYIYGEDLELDAKINQSGYKLFFIPNIIVKHKHRSNLKDFLRQMYEFGKARVRVGRQYKNFSTVYHYGPMFLFVISFSPLIILPILMSLINSIFVFLKVKNPSLILPTILLTLLFYISYGAGEFMQFINAS